MKPVVVRQAVLARRELQAKVAEYTRVLTEEAVRLDCLCAIEAAKPDTDATKTEACSKCLAREELEARP